MGPWPLIWARARSTRIAPASRSTRAAVERGEFAESQTGDRSGPHQCGEPRLDRRGKPFDVAPREERSLDEMFGGGALDGDRVRSDEAVVDRSRHDRSEKPVHLGGRVAAHARPREVTVPPAHCVRGDVAKPGAGERRQDVGELRAVRVERSRSDRTVVEPLLGVVAEPHRARSWLEAFAATHVGLDGREPGTCVGFRRERVVGGDLPAQVRVPRLVAPARAACERCRMLDLGPRRPPRSPLF